jgi:hypothetical protein
MPAIDQLIVQDFIDAGLNAQTMTEQGRALEDLICYVFGLVGGIAVTHRNEMNVFETEEIDVALWNDGAPDGFHFLPSVILVECKNWSTRVGSHEVSWFINKLRSRGMDFGILISTKGITGNSSDLTAAHHIVAMSLAERRRLLVITTDELLALSDTDGLTLLVKTKLCDLAVRGTL